MNALTKEDSIRFSAAYAYWVKQGETTSTARQSAMDQIDFEDRMNEPEWKGSNDSLENLPWI
jgi:hypothetical protein